MKERTLQKFYSVLGNRTIRIVVLKSANLIGIRHLLVRMDTNNLCSLRCQMCPEVRVRKSRDFKPTIMSLESFKKVAKHVFPKAHVLYISCAGEPLLTPGFEEYIRVAGSYRVPFLAFITNGMNLTSRVVASSIESGVAQISISADGASAQTFESVRTGASFSKLLDTLSMIRNMKIESKSKKPEVRLNFTISKSNWHEVDVFIVLAHQYGVGSVQFRPLTPFANNPWSVKNQLNDNEERELGTIFKSVEDKASRYGIKLLGHGEFTGKGVSEKGSLLDTCVYPWFYRYIHPDGRIKLCARRSPVGNLLNTSYAEIMDSDEVKKIKMDVFARNEGCRAKCVAGLAATEL